MLRELVLLGIKTLCNWNPVLFNISSMQHLRKNNCLFILQYKNKALNIKKISFFQWKMTVCHLLTIQICW
jgi:hypothetical protein